MSIRIANNDISVVVRGYAIAPYPVDPPADKAHDESEEKGKAKGKSKPAAKPTARPDQVEPPYDGENATGSGRRMEETFLLETTPRITPGGVLIYIIPHHRINDKIARHLAGLTTLDAQGNFVTATEPQQIKDLLDRYVEQLAKLVEARNVPQYDLRPEPWEWAVFDPLSKDRYLPGRVETGLTTFQKHLSIALGRLLLTTGAGGVNSEMGSGKSTIALAVAEYLRVAQERRGRKSRAFPGLIAGPGIVTGAENWPDCSSGRWRATVTKTGAARSASGSTRR